MSKIDELKQKFTDFLEDLKKKLPSKFSKKADDEIDDESEEFEEDEDNDEEIDLDDEFDEVTGKVKIDPQQLAKNDDDEEDDEEEDEDKAKKKKQILIRGLLGVVILYLAFDTFMNTEDDTSVNEAQVQQMVKKRPKHKRKKRIRKKIKKNKNINQNKKVDKAIQQKQVEQKIVDGPTSEVKAQPTPEVVTDPTPIPITKPDAIEKPKPITQVEVTPEVNSEAKPKKAKKEVKKKDEMTIELNDNGNKLGENMDKKIDNDVNSVTDAIMNDLKEKKTGREEEVTQAAKEKETPTKVNSDIAYVSPPDYRRLGRGLVYNCSNQHWACVDKFAYFQCRENYKYNKVQKKKFECMVRNVYASNEDCRVIQTYYINMAESTDFCNRSIETQSGPTPTKTTIELN